MCVLCSRLLFPYLVRFRSLLVHSFQVCVICEGVFKSCLLYSMLSGLLVIPGVSTLPCVTLMSSLKTIILKYLLVCVFLVSPCCVHRDRHEVSSKREGSPVDRGVLVSTTSFSPSHKARTPLAALLQVVPPFPVRLLLTRGPRGILWMRTGHSITAFLFGS